MRRLLTILWTLTALSLPLASLAQDLPVAGGHLVEGTIGDFTSLIPMITSDSGSHEVGELVYNGLVKYDKDLNLVGDLAESWEVSPDGLTITFHLRHGVRFSDGHPYTAQDAVFNWKFMVDPKTPTPYAGDYQKVKDAKALDDYTFQVTYDEPFAPGLASWSLPQMPRHLLEGQDPRTSSLQRQPVGTGAYLLARWDPGARLILKANPDYFEGRAYLDEIMYRVIPDTATIFLELQAGGVDMAGLNELQYSRQTDTDFFKDNFRKYKYLASGYVYLGYNQKDPRFQDKRVRQAISYAINKEEIIKGVMLGLGEEATGPYKPGTYWYNPNVKRYPFDQAKAKELLAQAGWTDHDGDGWLDKDGQRFEFGIITNQGNHRRINSGVIIQHRLAQIGVKVEIKVIEWAAFINEFINTGRFEACILSWSIPADPDLYDVWHSSKIGQLNHIHYANKELDALLDAGRRTFDRAERKKIYDRCQEILAEDQPYTFLMVPDALPIVHKRFQNIQPAPAGIGYNLIRWWVPKDLQRPTLLP